MNRLLLFMLVFVYSPFATAIETTQNDIVRYFEKIENFKSDFYQIEENQISEGSIFVSNERLRIEYITPSNILFIMKKNKVMYFNKEISEVQYFDPKNTPADFFIKIFNDSSFFEEFDIIHKLGHLVLSSDLVIDGRSHDVSIYFETTPLELKKIDIRGDVTNLSFSVLNINYNP